MSLIIVGSVAFDTIETPFGKREKIVGGSGLYSALAASYFTNPSLVSVIGKDFSAKTIEFLKSRGIDTSGIKVKRGQTFSWHGRYLRDLNVRKTIKTSLNVFSDFRPALPDHFKKPDILFLANLNPEHHEFILSQIKSKCLVALDTIKLWIETKRNLLLKTLKQTNLFFLNDEEARLIVGETSLIVAGKNLQRLGPELVIIKKGEHGAVVFWGDDIFSVTAHPCDHVVDPTGAGDSFAGGFLGYLDSVSGRLSGLKLRRAAVYGSVVASFVIEDFGIERFCSLDRAQVEGRFRQFRKMMSI